ncbi:phosphatidate cytidylyltransferase [Rhodovibrionaceae bacterium A322]
MSNPAQPVDSGQRAVILRTLSALVMAPPVLAAFYFGAPYSDLVLLLAGGAAAWEYAHMREGQGALSPVGLGLMACVLITVGLSALGIAPSLVSGYLAFATVSLALLAFLHSRSSGAVKWYAFGVLYIGLPLFCLQWLLKLGSSAPSGAGILIWLLVVVWATDIGAYIAGRSLGGPKLIPALSPKKTWSGLMGGMLAAGLAGHFLAPYLSFTQLPMPWLLGAGLAVVAQAGDFLESGMKRHYNVKDASQLIPGHGGVLDRVDGLITAVLLLSLFVVSGVIVL